MSLNISLNRWLRIAVLVVLAWTLLCVVGAAGSYSDATRLGHAVNYWQLVYAWLFASQPMMALSFVLYLAFERWHDSLIKAKNIAQLYLAVMLLFYPAEILFQAALSLHDNGKAIEWSSLVATLSIMPKQGWFLDFVVTSTTYAAIVAIRLWQVSRHNEQALHRAITDNLQLNLELEKQKLNAVRAQLEPHFLFNALNAISALVRSDDKRIAILALNRLSDLLRYALTASQNDWVSFADELKFIEDYLTLQKLRYGGRLQLHIDGDTPSLRGGDCPPLLLQPLVENALRHDLDGHQGSSDIVLSFSVQHESLHIVLSNPVHPHRAPNPGLGLGIKNTSARLQSLYGARAQLQTQQQADRFVVMLDMPLYKAE